MEATWRPTWRVWLALAAIALGVTAVLWYRSDADLADLDRRAAASGLATSWSAFARPRSPAPRLASWLRLEQLAAAVGSYADAYESAYDKHRPPQPGQPLPAELAAHHAALPAAELAELLSLCDGLAGVTLDRHQAIDWSTRMPEIDAARRVARVLVERAALVDGAHVADECARLLDLATVHRPISLIQGLVAVSQLSLWCGAAARRLHEPGVDRQRLAAQAERGRRWLAEAMPEAWRGEFVFVRTLMHESVRGRTDLGQHLAGEVMPSRLAALGLGRPVLRQARGAVLSDALTWMALIAPTVDHRTRLAHCAAVRGASRSDWLPADRLGALLLDHLRMSASAWAKTDVRLGVVAAEAGGGAWPDDPTDPAGHAVRRIERDGRLIGYYLLGDNGVDDGGSTSPRRDECVALYDRLGTPRAADPLPPPEPPSIVLPNAPANTLAPPYFRAGDPPSR